MEANVIASDFKHGKNFKLGNFCIIESGVVVGDNVTIESFCVLKKGVVIGDGTVMKNYVELREGTIIGRECQIDSRVSSSGDCEIGNRVTLRYDTIIARGVKIGDGTYVCPRVMTNNLDTEQNQIGGAHIGENCFIGTNAVIQHGITIQNNTIIGSLAFVNKDCDADSVYIGIPAKKK